MMVLNYMIPKTQPGPKILQNNLGLWAYLDVLSLSFSPDIFVLKQEDSHLMYAFGCYSTDSDLL